MGWSPVREAWARVLEECRAACRRAAGAAELAAETGAAAPAEAAARECARLAALLERLAERDVLPGNPRWRHHFSPPRAAVAGGGRLAALAVKGGSDFFRALFPPSGGGRSGLALFSTLAGYRVAILVFEASPQPRPPILWMSGAPAEFARSAVYRKAAVWGASAVADRVAWTEGLERSPDAAAALRLAVSALLSCAGGGDRVLFALPAAEADRLLSLASGLGLRRLPTGARRLRFLLLDAAERRGER